LNTYYVAKASQMSELKPLVITVEGRKIGIYKFGKKYYAYENECPHQGGPAVEGEVVGHYTCDFDPQTGKRLEEYFSKQKYDIVCPWHGTQYDLETGVCTGDNRRRLISCEVVIDGDDLKLRI
jgi:nitrite reductase (NADH) small subunit